MRAKFVYRYEDGIKKEDRKVVSTFYGTNLEDYYLSLQGRAGSASSLSCVEGLLAQIIALEQRKYKVGQVRVDAMAALLFDLLRVEAKGHGQFGYISLRSGTFTGKAIGYRPFLATYHGLLKLGFVEVQPGFHRNKEGTGEATRMRASHNLLEYLFRHGITPANHQSHFRIVPTKAAIVADPIRVRVARLRDYWNPHRGPLLQVDYTDPDVIKMAAQVQQLNAFFATVDIDGCEFRGLYRLFNRGDEYGFDYQWGGRLYAIGSYQRMKRTDRPNIRINGEETVEVDVSASHITLLHSIMGVPLHPAMDPYIVPGVGNRTVVKIFVTMALGHGGFQTRWGRESSIRYLNKELGIEHENASDYTKAELARLKEDFPIAKVREAVLDHLPLLGSWPTCPKRWADLQHQESLGLIATVEALAFEHGVPALPLHDSVIVPVSKAELAERVMTEAFKAHAKADIRASIK